MLKYNAGGEDNKSDINSENNDNNKSVSAMDNKDEEKEDDDIDQSNNNTQEDVFSDVSDSHDISTMQKDGFYLYYKYLICLILGWKFNPNTSEYIGIRVRRYFSKEYN